MVERYKFDREISDSWSLSGTQLFGTNDKRTLPTIGCKRFKKTQAWWPKLFEMQLTGQHIPLRWFSESSK